MQKVNFWGTELQIPLNSQIAKLVTLKAQVLTAEKYNPKTGNVLDPEESANLKTSGWACTSFPARVGCPPVSEELVIHFLEALGQRTHEHSLSQGRQLFFCQRPFGHWYHSLGHKKMINLKMNLLYIDWISSPFATALTGTRPSDFVSSIQPSVQNHLCSKPLSMCQSHQKQLASAGEDASRKNSCFQNLLQMLSMGPMFTVKCHNSPQGDRCVLWRKKTLLTHQSW